MKMYFYFLFFLYSLTLLDIICNALLKLHLAKYKYVYLYIYIYICACIHHTSYKTIYYQDVEKDSNGINWERDSLQIWKPYLKMDHQNPRLICHSLHITKMFPCNLYRKPVHGPPFLHFSMSIHFPYNSKGWIKGDRKKISWKC